MWNFWKYYQSDYFFGDFFFHTTHSQSRCNFVIPIFNDCSQSNGILVFAWPFWWTHNILTQNTQSNPHTKLPKHQFIDRIWYCNEFTMDTIWRDNDRWWCGCWRKKKKNKKYLFLADRTEMIETDANSNAFKITFPIYLSVFASYGRPVTRKMLRAWPIVLTIRLNDCQIISFKIIITNSCMQLILVWYWSSLQTLDSMEYALDLNPSSLVRQQYVCMIIKRFNV